MSRVTVLSTITGLLGLILAMSAVLSGESPTAILVLSFTMVLLGFLGAVVGATLALAQVESRAR